MYPPTGLVETPREASQHPPGGQPLWGHTDKLPDFLGFRSWPGLWGQVEGSTWVGLHVDVGPRYIVADGTLALHGNAL